MQRKYPYREPHILTGTTPAGAAAAVTKLAYAAVRVSRSTAYAYGKPSQDEHDVAAAAGRLCAGRIQDLASELIAPMFVRVMDARNGNRGSYTAADILLVRGWRRRFPGLLGR